MSYKNNASSNKDFLFGGSSSSSSSKKPSKSGATPTPSTSSTTSKGYSYGKKTGTGSTTRKVIGLQGEAKTAKIKEAEEYCEKAKKAMQKGLFSKADPLAASTYYKRAADAYQLAGEGTMERLQRMNSADCQKRVGAWATAAAEYSRAAELVQSAEDMDTEQQGEVSRKLYLDAAGAYRQMNDPGKAAAATVQAAMALLWGDDESQFLPKIALSALEEAVESFVPDPLNPYARYRQTGYSAYVNPDSEETAENPSPEALELANTNLITSAYAHEPLQEVLHLLVGRYAEYASALYTAGAISVLLEANGVSTLSLSRAFVAETILSLAMGDPIAAEEQFLQRHVQKTSYLSSRECKLAEELFRAVKMRDPDALEEARDPKGTNRSGIGNLPPALKELLPMLRLNGVARKGEPDLFDKKTSEKKEKKSTSKVNEPSLEELAAKTGYDEPTASAVAAAGKEDEVEEIDAAALQDELDALDFGDDEESDLDDDDIDLR